MENEYRGGMVDAPSMMGVIMQVRILSMVQKPVQHKYPAVL